MKANKNAGTEITNWSEELAKLAVEDSERMQMPGGSFISFQGGVITIAGNEVDGDKLPIVVLDSVYENDFYQGNYVPDKPASPVCFALSRTDEAMVPHEKSVDKQNDTCFGCPHMVWGTARRQDGSKGKGKACQSRMRLGFISANDLSAPGIKDGEALFARLPVTSVKAWAYYVKGLAESLKRPPWSVITEMALMKSKKNQFNVTFTVKDMVPNEYLTAVKERHLQMEKDIMFPYTGGSVAEEVVPEEPKKRARY